MDDEIVFEITFPISIRFNQNKKIEFSMHNKGKISIGTSLYYIMGENGSGKSSFLDLLSLVSGEINGSDRKPVDGSIRFREYDYQDSKFNHIESSRIREKYFSIFSQEIYLIPGLTIGENNKIINGDENSKLKQSNKMPEQLSGGELQSAFIDIVLKDHKQVWFCDEPLNNLDKKNRLKFWIKIGQALAYQPKTIFVVDHTEKEKKKQFFKNKPDVINTLIVNNGKTEIKQICIFRVSYPPCYIINKIAEACETAAPCER